MYYHFMFQFPCIVRLYYIKDQQDATLAVCLLVTARLLYMFRTLSESIIRSTKNCISSHWCVSWVGMIYIPWGCPRSATDLWVRMIYILWGRPRLATDLGHPHRIYIIPTHDTHQRLLIQFLVLLMMDAKSIRNMYSNLAVTNKHTAKVASCWSLYNMQECVWLITHNFILSVNLFKAPYTQGLNYSYWQRTLVSTIIYFHPVRQCHSHPQHLLYVPPGWC
jgi:hypothetical protein